MLYHFGALQIQAFTCPMLHQHPLLNLHLGPKSIDTDYGRDKVMKSFLDMKSLLAYSGLSVPMRAHELGAADMIPKDSEMMGSLIRWANTGHIVRDMD